jgi:soluble lytic murein transglycosylase-like protein
MPGTNAMGHSAGTMGYRGLWVAVSLAFVPLTARADVIEIAPTGAVITYKGPTQFLGASATALSPATQPSAAPLPANANTPSFPVRMHPVLAGYLDDAATRYSVDKGLVQAVAWQESRFRSDVISPKGAIGMMQLMPATATQLGVNPYDPQQNINGGVAYLSTLLTQFRGDVRLALAAYNAGPAAVLQYGGIPPYRETQIYVKSISERLSLR